MKSFQQQMALRMLGLIIAGAVLFIPYQFFDPQTQSIDLLVTSGSACLLLGLWFACRYSWRYGRYAVLVALVLMTALARTEPNISRQLSLDIFLPTVMALLLGSLPWVIGSATVTYVLLMLHANGQGVYMQLDTLISYALVIGGVVLARHVTDTAQRAAEASAQNALAQAQQLADKNDELRRRDAIMEAVGFAARQFLEGTDWRQHIQPVLQQLGTAARVERVAIFENVPDSAGELHAMQHHVWFVEGHAQASAPREQRAFSYRADGLARWADQLGHDAPIYGHRSSLPAAEQQLLAGQHVQSLAVIPIFVRQSWWGFMSYVAGIDEREWLAAEIEALKLAAGILGAAIQRDDAEAALRKSEATNRALLNAIPDLMARMTRSGVVLDLKAAKANHLNISPTDMIGRHVIDLLPPEVAQTVLHANQQALHTGEAQIFECALSLHGTMREYEAQVAVCGEDEVLAIVRDITERKNVDRMKTEFISVVSHELRTPLTSIRGALGLVTNGVAGEVSPQALTMLEIARKNSERLVRLINDMLDIEKIESGKMAFNLRPVAIAALVEQAVEANRTYGAQLGVLFDFSHTLPGALVYGDSDRLMQVFVNLLSNAAKFSPAGSTVYITVDRHDAEVRIAVTDCGQGIPVGFPQEYIPTLCAGRLV